MTTVARAREQAAMGQIQAAQETLDQILRIDPGNVDAWRLAVEIAPTESLRANARSGLQRALAMEQQQPAPMVPAQAMHPAQVYPARPYEKDYMGEAFLTLLLYYVGAGVIGLIANILFLNNAKRDRASGIPVHNVGCLQAVLIVHLAAMVLGCVGVLFVFVLLPMVGIVLSGS